MNTIKRRTPPPAGTTLHKLTFDDFQALQDAVDSQTPAFPHGRGTDLTRAQRTTIETVGPNGIGEGDFVQLIGFMPDETKNPRANTGESVNCGLTTQKNNDFHVNLVEDETGTEFEGIVAEMVPQDRPAGWNLKMLRLARRGGRQVLVRGLLFYDNVHDVRTDPDENPNGNSPRFSLWEIHPITEFRVCLKKDNSCKALQQWRKLETLTINDLKPFQPK